MGAVLFWIIVGVIAGALAKAVVPGEEDGGLLGSMVLGIGGALVGGWVAGAIFGYRAAGLITTTFIAFLGAVVVLMLWNWATGRRRAM